MQKNCSLCLSACGSPRAPVPRLCVFSSAPPVLGPPPVPQTGVTVRLPPPDLPISTTATPAWQTAPYCVLASNFFYVWHIQPQFWLRHCPSVIESILLAYAKNGFPNLFTSWHLAVTLWVVMSHDNAVCLVVSLWLSDLITPFSTSNNYISTRFVPVCCYN